jgi:uncharacterized protein YjlB
VDGRYQETVARPEVVQHRLEDAGTFPNNERLPLLAYKGALELPERDPAALIEDLFQAHGWSGAWRDGIYGFHHYHSTSHEVLGVYQGSARVQFGGDQGVVLAVERGDVVVIPAGVAHKNLGSSHDLGVVGAYAHGRDWDMNYGKPDERPQADDQIAQVPMPEMDPILGQGGPLTKAWREGGDQKA